MRAAHHTDNGHSAEIYNAGKKIEVVATLWRGEDKLAALPSDPLVPPPDGSLFQSAVGCTMANSLSAGTYVLQLAATSDDPKNAKKDRTAVQRISFDVRRRSSKLVAG